MTLHLLSVLLLLNNQFSPKLSVVDPHWFRPLAPVEQLIKPNILRFYDNIWHNNVNAVTKQIKVVQLTTETAPSFVLTCWPPLISGWPLLYLFISRPPNSPTSTNGRPVRVTVANPNGRLVRLTHRSHRSHRNWLTWRHRPHRHYLRLSFSVLWPHKSHNVSNNSSSSPLIGVRANAIIYTSKHSNNNCPVTNDVYSSPNWTVHIQEIE